MKKVITGLDKLSDPEVAASIKGNIAYLCHAASIDNQLNHGITIIKHAFGDRFKKIFSPQHGLFGELQDNMIESDHFFHPYFRLPVYSLYSETRVPTKEMLEGIDQIIIDLQDVGTRVYTYIWTMILGIKAAGENGMGVVVLDRPNPLGGIQMEGNILEPEFSSFVGLYPIPMRHGLTIGEIANMAKSWGIEADLTIMEMENWSRKMYFDQTGLPWVMPSPNLPTLDSAMAYPGTVLFEGTNISEGRGTTRSLEVLGHPDIEPFELLEQVEKELTRCGLKGFRLRPLTFVPTFNKHEKQTCGGYQIHITNRKLFQPWRTGLHICRVLRAELGHHFIWKTPPYEYEFTKMPFDILNGSDVPRSWVENNGSENELNDFGNIRDFEAKCKDYLLYQ